MHETLKRKIRCILVIRIFIISEYGPDSGMVGALSEQYISRSEILGSVQKNMFFMKKNSKKIIFMCCGSFPVLSHAERS